MSLRPLLPIRGVLEMLVASLCGDSCLDNRRWRRRHVVPRVLGSEVGWVKPYRHPRTGCVVQDDAGDLCPATVPSLRSGCGSWARAVHDEPWPATRAHRLCRRLTPRCAGRGASAGAAEYRGVAGMAGLGDAAGAADVNTFVPAWEAGTGLRSPPGPGAYMGLSLAELSQPLESIMYRRAVSHRGSRCLL